MAVVFASTGKNNGTAIAIAAMAFSPMVAIPAATMPIFQVLLLVGYLKLAAGLLVLGWGWQRADPIVSLVTAVLVLWAGWGLLRDTTHVLMEGTPRELDPDVGHQWHPRRQFDGTMHEEEPGRVTASSPGAKERRGDEPARPA
jgi:hypothetical protein